jgi:uncharacterized protein (DUF1501 family)
MLSRRVFLKHGGLALVSVGLAPRFLERTIEAAGTRRRKVLITIFQRGAVDGLNMVIPFGERAYYAARPSIAISRPGLADGALDLDGFFGLHPRLAPLAPLWQSRQLAVVHACGSPDGTRSHFDAQDYMETATPGIKSTRDGWLNRYLHAREHAEATPFRAVALSNQIPRSLQGVEPALAINQIGQFGIRPGEVGDVQGAFESQYAAAADTVLNRTGSEAFEAVRLLKSADPAKYRSENGAEYPRSAYGDALRQVAQLVKADVGLEVAFAEVGGWDTHVNQGSSAGQLAARLDDFSRGLAALVRDLGDRMADVVILTMSEFGRAVAENGNRGTDHGHGNAMMVIGGEAVRGGKVYGHWPGLRPEQRYEGRDLAVTTDFRSVFNDVVRDHLGVTDTSSIFPGFQATAPLGFLA